MEKKSNRTVISFALLKRGTRAYVAFFGISYYFQYMVGGVTGITLESAAQAVGQAHRDRPG